MRDFDLIGSRVVLRSRVGERDGRPLFSDVIGELVEITDTAAVRQADGSVRRIPISAVHRLKAVPPGRADALALAEVAARGWPAPRTGWLGRWLLRDGGGWTMRANSALLLGDPGRPVMDALAEVARWYRERDLTPRLAIPLPWLATADRAADRTGWVTELDLAVLTGPVAPRRPGGDVPEVRVEPVPSDGWLGRYRAGAIPPVGRAILTAPEQVGFASLTDGTGVVAIGRGVVTDRWLGVAAIEVHPTRRRQGLARQIMAGLLAWGAERGAARCHLQVELDNAAALALYADLGFTPHHRYRYRTAGS
ncbi:MAG: GNAT family N-acetyltransferase [Actinobacteria bacterium]|nr:GNAT family N-acetyltransferase [Actinomycetota bacterium]MBI3687995.1 GNAT family N-acetyltransferase [Actinomycetota bacterium]